MPLFFPEIQTFSIDMSDRSIKISQVQKKRSKLILNSLGERDIPPGFISDGIINKDKELSLIKIIQDCLSGVNGAKIKTKKAVCSLPEENSFIKVIQIPEAREEEIGDLIKWQIESNFPVKLKDVYFDWQVIKGNSKRENKKSAAVCVAVVPRDVINSYLFTFKKAGIDPVVFEIESMSATRGLIREFVKKPIIVLDVGKCGTGLTVFSGETILFTSHIDIGGQRFTDAISRSLNIKSEEAESVKRKVGLRAIQEKGVKLSAVNFPITNLIGGIKDFEKKEKKKKIGIEENIKPEEVFNSLVPSLTDLTEQIKHYIDYFRDFKELDGISSGDIGKIIICGGEAKMIGFVDFISKSLNVSAEIGNPIKEILVSKSISKNPSPYQFLSYTTVIGLAIRGINNSYVGF